MDSISTNDVNSQKAPFFIVGNSRSGTTLMARILRKHPDLYVLKETFIFDDLQYERNNYDNLSEQDLRDSLNRMFTIQDKGYYRRNEQCDCKTDVDTVISLLNDIENPTINDFIKTFYVYEAIKHEKLQSGDQTPRHVFHIKSLNKMFPSSRYINMVRDPRAVLLSQKNKWKATVRLGQPRFETFRTRINYHPITMALLWNRSIGAGINAERDLGQDKVKTVKFEDMVNKPNETINTVCDFLGVMFDDAMLQVPVEMSSNLSETTKNGIDAKIADVWKSKLTKTEIFLCQKITRKTAL